MLFGEIIAVYPKNRTKPINILCGQNALTVKAGGTWSYHWALKGLISITHFTASSTQQRTDKSHINPGKEKPLSELQPHVSFRDFQSC
jgi:hypothetical protein